MPQAGQSRRQQAWQEPVTQPLGGVLAEGGDHLCDFRGRYPTALGLELPPDGRDADFCVTSGGSSGSTSQGGIKLPRKKVRRKPDGSSESSSTASRPRRPASAQCRRNSQPEPAEAQRHHPSQDRRWDRLASDHWHATLEPQLHEIFDQCLYHRQRNFRSRDPHEEGTISPADLAAICKKSRHVAELLLNGVDFDPFQHRRPEQDLPYSEAYFEQMCVRDHDMISRDDFLHFYWDKVFHPHERVHYDEELSETVDDDDVTADHDSRDTPTDSSDRPWPTSTYLEDGVSGPSYHPGSYSPLQQRAQSVPGGRWIHEPFAFTPERRQAEPAAPVDSYANWKEKWLYAPETPLKPSRKAPRQARSDRVNRGAQMRAAWGKDRFLNGIADRKFDLRSCGHDGKFARQAACRRSNLLIPDYVPPHEKRRDGLRQRVRQNLLVPAFLPP